MFQVSHLELLLVGFYYIKDVKFVTLCYTEEAIEETLARIGLFDESMYDSLKCKVIRTPRQWTNHGSDEKILQWQAPNQRPLVSICKCFNAIKYSETRKT